jgi:hypothetical protein
METHMSDFEDDLYDPYENSGPAGPPALSWKKADKGDEFTGIVIPPDVFEPSKGYVARQDISNSGDRMVWPPKAPGYAAKAPDPAKPKRPITEEQYAEIALALGVDTPPRKVSVAHIWFLTDYSKFEYVSGRAKDKMAEQEITIDAGLRRIIESGAELPKAIKDALAKVGGKPLPGQIWTVKLMGRTANEYGGETSNFVGGVTILKPTPESLAKVEAYVASKKAGADDEGTGYVANEQDPPF